MSQPNNEIAQPTRESFRPEKASPNAAGVIDPFSAERFGASASTLMSWRNGHDDAALPQVSLTDARPQFFVSPDGNDRNPGTAEQPWQTIQKGARSATAGSVVNVMPGEYHGQVNITVSGNERDGFITFRSAVPGKAVLDLTGQGGSEPAGFKIENQKFIEVSGFEIKNLRAQTAEATPNGVLINGASNHIHLSGLDIHHIENNINRHSNAHGISVYGNGPDAASTAHDIVIDHNNLHDLKLGASEALVVNGNVDYFTISNNNLYRLNNIGIDVVGYEGISTKEFDRARHGTISNNSISDVDSRGNPAYGSNRSAGGIYVDGGTMITISGNKVERANIGIELASEHPGKATSQVHVTNNILRHNTMAGIVLGGAARSNGGSGFNLIDNNRLENNDTDHTGSGEIAVQNHVHNTTVVRNTLVSSGVMISGSTTGNDMRDNDLQTIRGG